MRATLGISALVHGALFALLSRCEVERPSAVVESSAPAIPVVEIVPIEVALVEDPPARAAAVDVPVRGAARAGTPPPAIAKATAARPGDDARLAASTERPPSTSPPDTPPASALGMRGRRHDLSLSRELGGRIVGEVEAPGVLDGAPVTGVEGLGPKGRPDESDARWAHDPKIKLVPSGRGNHEVRDRVAKFRVAPDGGVSIAHAPEFTFDIHIPWPSDIFKAFKYQYKRWEADVYRDRDVGRTQDLPAHLLASPGACDSAGPLCMTAADWQEVWRREDEAVGDGSLVSGAMDITAYLARKFGVGDAYASRKLKILDQTRDERVAIGEQFRTEQRGRSMELVQRNLEQLWRATSDPAGRRAALFALWDECGEGEGPAGEAGDRARLMVIAWIRSRLPAGAPGAFTAGEIAELDRRRSSRQHFAPYE